MPGINMMPSGSTLQIPLDACTNFSGKAGNAQVTLTWTDPKDKYATPEGETAQDPDQLVSVWEYTQIIRKTGSQPTGPHDGELVVSSSVRDQYATSGFVDTGLVNGTLYYYAAFAYNTDGVASEGAFVTATPMAGTPLSSLAVGTVVKISENGTPAEYIVVNQGIPGKSSLYDNSCDGVWMLRLNIYADVQWSSAYNDYAQSYVNGYLNSSFLEMFSDYVQSIIHQVKVPYRPGAGGSFTASTGENGLSTKVFLPSAAEVSFYNSRMPRNEGVELSFFVGCADDAPDSKRSASLNGQLSEWWLRTPYCSNGGNDNDAWRVTENGSCHYPLCSSPSGVRPVIILPFSALVDQDLNLIET